MERRCDNAEAMELGREHQNERENGCYWTGALRYPKAERCVGDIEVRAC